MSAGSKTRRERRRNKNKLKWNKRSKKVYVSTRIAERWREEGENAMQKTRKEEEREEEEKSKSNSPRKGRGRGWIGSRKRKTRKKEKQSTSHACGSCTICCTVSLHGRRRYPVHGSWSSWGHHMLSLYCIGICIYSRSDAGIPRICNVLPVFSITPFHHDFCKPCATYPLRVYLSVLSTYFFIDPLLYGFLSLNIHIYAKVFEHSLLKY